MADLSFKPPCFLSPGFYYGNIHAGCLLISIHPRLEEVNDGKVY